MLRKWFAREARRHWWQHLLSLLAAIVVLVVWLASRPVNPWPGVVVLVLMIAVSFGLAWVSYQRSRRQPDGELD